VARDPHHAGFGVDFHFADVAAIGKARLRHGPVADRAERAVEIVRQVVAFQCGARHFEQVHRAVCSRHREAAGIEG
jgi:hypothetical protein